MFQKHRVAIQMKHRDLAHLLRHSTYETEDYGFHSMTLMAILAACFTATLLSPSKDRNKVTWDCRIFRPSGASASMVRVLTAFRRALDNGDSSKFRSRGMASESRAAYLPVDHQYQVLLKGPFVPLALISTSTDYKVNVYPYPI